MASFVKVQTNSGIHHKAIIRKKGVKQFSKTFARKVDARAWAAEQESLIEAKRWRDPRLAAMISIAEALSQYHEESELKGKKRSTLDRERYSMANLVRLLGDDATLADITAGTCNGYQLTRLEEGASNSSIRQELSMLSKMYRTAAKDWEINIANPVEDVERVAPGPERDRFLSDEEARLVVEEAGNSANKKFQPFVLLLLHTGMRTGEAAELHIDRVDLDRGEISITRTKSGKPRLLPLSNEVCTALKTIEPDDDGYYFLKANHRASTHIMLRPGCIFRDCWVRLQGRLAKRAEAGEIEKMAPWRPHDLRHTAGSHLSMAGVDIRIIADILGHSTLKMAMRYTHQHMKHRRKILDRIRYLGIGDQPDE